MLCNACACLGNLHCIEIQPPPTDRSCRAPRNAADLSTGGHLHRVIKRFVKTVYVLYCISPLALGLLCQLRLWLFVAWHQLKRPFLASLKARGGPRRGTRSFAAVIVFMPRVVPHYTALSESPPLRGSASPAPRLFVPGDICICIYISYNCLYDIRVCVWARRSNLLPK
jgi:hypothetical protein